MPNNTSVLDNFGKIYWSYYLMLERKFIETFDYIELDEINANAYSKNFLALLLNVGAEVDNFFKTICEDVYKDPVEKRSTITTYAHMIFFTDLLKIKNAQVKIIGIDKPICPFENWDLNNPSTSLKWWDAYNNIKHNRLKNERFASQNNALYALSGLFLLEWRYIFYFIDRKCIFEIRFII